MKASYRWLRELLGPWFDVGPRELAERLTRAGLEVEAVHAFGAASEQVVLARVVAREAHPSRPKLTLVTVDAGGGHTQRVVCGAPNVPEPGGVVVLARLGTHLPAAGLTLAPREIGGVASEGMLCSEAELGLRISGGEGGILVLPAGEPGAALARAVPAASDFVLEIGLTPNRPDGLGHVGLAREIAALYGQVFEHRAPRPTRVARGKDPSDVMTIRIEDLERCPSYGAALVEGVTIGPSPLGVQYRLEALGVRAISNVVDVTNLVMLKYGHPIHGFDFERVRGRRIVVRRAAPGEVLVTLDGASRRLEPDDLVIADAEGPVALAGVMGGRGSEIGEATRTVLVECAYFAPRGVRRTARRHGMHTESSHRFERGVDPGDIEEVLAESAHLLVELAGGTAAERTLVVGGGVAPRPPIRLRAAAMNALLGIDVPMAEARGILERLGCRETTGAAAAEARELAFAPPSHRPDLGIEADLVEEVIRVRGIDDVGAVIPAIRPQPPRGGSDVEGRVVRAAIEVGLSQALVYGFTSKKDLAALGAPEPAFVLANPLGEERAAMRTSLLPGLLDAVRRARRHGVADVRLFATGARFLPGDGGLAREARSFAAVVAGRRDAVLAKPEPVDVYDAKGIAVEIAERATRRPASAEPQSPEARARHLHPRAAANLLVEGRLIGSFGALHPEVQAALDLEAAVFVVEIDLDALAEIGVRVPRYRPVPTLPAATRDLAVVVHDRVPAGDVERAIAEVGGELVEQVEVFDLFRGGAVPPEHRSLAFHVVYRDPLAARDPQRARTLTDAEVDERHAAVVKAISERFGAELRA